MIDNVMGVLSAGVNGIPLVFVVFVMVELLKRLKGKDGNALIDGNGLLISSFVIGLLIGVGYMLATTEMTASFGYWFGVAVYGIALGGMASIFYEAIKSIVDKIVQRSLSRLFGAEE
jgi:hypothetical protein